MQIEYRKARYDYEFLEKWTAGMCLLGSEVKAIRNGSVDFSGSWCEIRPDGVYVKNLSITPWQGQGSHEVTRDRKILLRNKEIKKLEKMMDKGLSIIPVRILNVDYGHIKIEIALAKGKKNWDKRQTIKERDIARDLANK